MFSNDEIDHSSMFLMLTRPGLFSWLFLRQCKSKYEVNFEFFEHLLFI